MPGAEPAWGRPAAGEATIGALWLDDPRDGLTHAWRDVVEGGMWKARCGLVAFPATLTEPEDDFGRHDACMIALGLEVAEAQGDLSWRP